MGKPPLFSDKQLEIIAYANKHNPIITIQEGAIRSGKTHLNDWFFFVRVAEKAGQSLHFMITGFSIGSIIRNVLSSIEELFGLTIRLDKTNSFELFGNKIHCFGTDDCKSYKAITGFTCSGWYGNEVSLSHPDSIIAAFERCSTPDFWIIWDTNPDYPGHPIKKNYIDKSGETLLDGTVWIKSWHFTLDDNTYLTDRYKESVKKAIPKGVWHDRKILGLWVIAEGAIYPQWHTDIHVCDEFKIPDDWTRYRGIDLGYNNPFVCLWAALSPDDVLYIYNEHYKARELIKYHCKVIKDFDINNSTWKPIIESYYNSAGQESLPFSQEICNIIVSAHNSGETLEKLLRDCYVHFKCDMRYITVRDHDAQQGAEISDNNIYTSPARKNVEEGIQIVGKRLNTNQRNEPGIRIFRSCEHTIDEFSTYRWKPIKEGIEQKEEPIKVNDHCMDVIRYICQEIDWGGVQFWG